MNALRPKFRFTFRNKVFAGYRFLVFSLSALCVLFGPITAQDWKTVKEGVEYAEVTRDAAGTKVNINLLRLDLTKVRLDIAHAMDAAIGTEKTSSIAMRHGAFAAINGGFFRMDDSIWAGDAVGTLMIDKKLLSESIQYDERVAIGIINGAAATEVYFGHPSFVPTLDGDKFTVIGSDGINRERLAGEIIVYTPEFGRTTLTNTIGVELIVRKNKIVAISKNGSGTIPQDGFVVSIEGDDAASRFNHWRVGARLRLSLAYTDAMYDWEPDIIRERQRLEKLLMFPSKVLFKLEDITNGVPQLIKNSKIDITWEQEKTTKSFVETRHPRTAVAKLKDGKFLMLTVDGRSESSGGIGLQDLAEYLLSLGAIDAMNLDGGGSTTMFLDGKVVNHPSDKDGERKISDAILVTPRKKK